MKNLVFLDVEATGLDAEDRLVEVAYRTTGGIPICEFFKAPLPVKLAAMSINNITNEMLESANPFLGSMMHSNLSNVSSDHILVAHNAIYDLDMLKKEGIYFKEHICTMKIAHFLDKNSEMEKHTLSYCRYYFKTDVVEANPHTAIGDITILEGVFNVLKDRLRVELFLGSEDEVIDKMVEISSNPIIFKKFSFGKYEGLLLSDVAQNHCPDGKGRDYLKWLLSQKINNPSGQEADWIYTLNYYLNAYEPISR